MLGKQRTNKLAILGFAALALALGAVAPAFAWHLSTFTTQVNPSTSVPQGTTVTDTASFTGCDGTHPCGSASGSMTGSVTFTLYSNDGCTGTAVATDTKSGPFANPATVTSDGFSTSSLTPGSYSFSVAFAGTGSWATASAKAGCEPFILTKFPPTVPQFPLGLALVLALAIPGLLLIRGKFASKLSSAPVNV